MREAVDAERIREFMRSFARLSGAKGLVYFTGGASAVLHQWRSTTVHVDIKVIPDSEGVYDAIRGLSFHHYDFYSQCLSKIERGHRKDLADVHDMLASGLVERERLLALFERIEPDLKRYPAIDPPSFRRAVLATTLKLQ